MKVEDRSGVYSAGTQIILICENDSECSLFDLLGKPDDKVKGELHLSDGYGEFYIRLEPNL